MKIQGLILAAVAIVLMLVVGSAQAADVSPIRIGVGIDPAYLPFYVAQGKGLYVKNGLEATTKVFVKGGDALDAITAGQMDVAATTEPQPLAFFSRDADVILTAITMRAPDNIKIVSKSVIQRPHDLIGKTVAVVPGTASEYVWLRYMAVHRLPEGSVKFRNIDPPETVALLDKGEIDAFCLWEPWPFRAQEISRGKVRVLAASADNGVYTTTQYLEVRGEYARTSPEGVRRLIRSLIEASEFIQKNSDEATKILASWTKVSTDEAGRLRTNFSYPMSWDKEANQTLREVATWLKKNKKLAKEIDFSKLVQTEYLRTVKPSAVRD